MNETLKTILEETFWLLIPMAIGYFVNILRRSKRVNIYKNYSASPEKSSSPAKHG